MKNIILSSAMLWLVTFTQAQEKRWIRKAGIAVDRCDYEKAIQYYDMVLKKDSSSFHGNAGKGVVLSEYMEQHELAIPYLENALNTTPEKTKMKLNYDLGKSYHRLGNYNRALYFYGRALPYNKESHPEYDVYLTKRIADCKYAMKHPEIAAELLQSVTNVGYPINTDKPEYSPVFVRNAMIFTSQRKDSKRERKNGMDGRYFESMYVSKFNNGSFTDPQRYTVPDLGENSKYLKHNESILSTSCDGKKIFIYRNARIYEANLDDLTKDAQKLGKNINFSGLQSHACLSADEKTIFFASDSKEGAGYIDIYKADKESDGTWGLPVLLPFNTMYNEDSPYISTDGTLYFSSNGLPGYGGYDIYKTRLENGRWTIPENLGQPTNSPADDIYFTLKPNSSFGYFSSNRLDGKGDLDIYMVHYIPGEIPECKPEKEDVLAINTKQDSLNKLAFHFEMQFPKEFAQEASTNHYSWKVNNMVVSQATKFDYSFNTPGDYTVTARAILYCDTCPQLKALCSETVVNVSEEILAKQGDTVDVKNLPVNDYPVAGNNIPKSKEKKRKDVSKAFQPLKALSDKELDALSWNKKPVQFILNDYALQEDLKPFLDKNIGILKNNRNLRIEVYGHTDSRGSEPYNSNLSFKRAEAVKNYLVKNGISPGRITIYGNGETMLLNNCNDLVECTEEEHAINRRVEFKLYRRGEVPITAK